INAMGEFQAAEKMADAAKVLSTYPVAIQLRFLQTLTEVAAESPSRLIFPVPVDLVTPLLEKTAK
nr:slipin family protein [Pseudomonadota bacterium]